jgi:Ni,Fe-hydrogenase III small subunit
MSGWHGEVVVARAVALMIVPRMLGILGCGPAPEATLVAAAGPTPTPARHAAAWPMTSSS